MEILAPVLKSLKKHFTTNELNKFELSLTRREVDVFNGILLNNVVGNVEVSKIYFGATPSNSSFQNVKRSMKSKLFNFISGRNGLFESTSIIEYKSLVRMKLVIATLMSMNLRKEALLLLNKSIRKAGKLHLYPLMLSFLDIRIKLLPISNLCLEEELKIFKKISSICVQEMTITGYYTDIQSDLKKGNSIKIQLIEKVENYCKKTDISINDTPVLADTSFRLKVLLQQMKYDYVCVELLCYEALKALSLFNLKKSNRRIIHFTFVLIYSKLKNGNYLDALNKVKEEQAKEIDKKSWIQYQELYIISAFRLGDFNLVKEAMVSAHEKASADELIRVWSTRYELYMFYQYLMVRAGEIELEIKENIVNRRYNKLVKKFRSDKKGFYIPVLIGELLNFCFTDKLDFILDRVNAIKQYGIDHLNDEANIRSKTFIFMLTKVPLAQIQQKKFERDIIKLKKILADNPLVGSKQADELEIIPYEILWSILEKKIEKREIRLI